MITPKNYLGKDVVWIYRTPIWEYIVEGVPNFRENIDKFISKEQTHDDAGDNLLTIITDIDSDGANIVSSFVRGLESTSELTEEELEIKLRKKFEEQNSMN